MLHRLARWLVSRAAALVPLARREAFEAEWHAELAHRFDPEPPRSPPALGARLALTYRALLALLDALSLSLDGVTMDAFLHDLRFSVRSLVRRPGFTALALLTLALGIGANTAIFTVVHAVLLRPLPFPEPDRLVAVWEEAPERGWERVPVSAADYLAWHDEVDAFSALSAGAGSSYSLTGGDAAPEQVQGMAVSGDFFAVFGVQPALGGTFDQAASDPGASPVAVLSHGLWSSRYGSDPTLVGRTVEIDGRPTEVLGVMPEGFAFPSAARLWTPLQISEAQLSDRNWHFLLVQGRLAPGASLADARTQVASVSAGLAEAFPDSNEGWLTSVRELHGEMTQQVQGMLWVLLGAVGLVLLIACANVANLLLVRAAGRSRELSVRAAVGADRGRLVRQLFTEAGVLAVAGAVLGLGVAHFGLRLLLAVTPLQAPAGQAITMNLQVLAFAAGAAVVTGLLFGAAPAWSVWRSRIGASLREGARGAAGAGGHRTRAALVVAEIALALVLVTGAGLMVQSFMRLMQVDTGVRSEGVLVAGFSVPQATYPSAQEAVAHYDRVLERLAAVPGVEGVALGSLVPPAGGPQFHVRVEGVHEAWVSDLPVSRARSVSPGYFDALGIPLRRGRLLDDTDIQGSGRVVVVDQAFAESFFPGEEAIGRWIRTLDDDPRQIVGVVGNVSNAGLANSAQPTYYLPLRQTLFSNSQTLIVRTRGEPERMLPAVRTAFWEVDDRIPLVGVGTLADRLSAAVTQPRDQALLMGLFGVLALVLAGVGTYGVMAFTVRERTREMGLRMALGATGGDVQRWVLRRALGLTAVGIVVGLGASLLLGRTVSSLLFGVAPWDPGTLFGVTAILVGVSVLASWLPARRAARLDPLVALREG